MRRPRTCESCKQGEQAPRLFGPGLSHRAPAPHTGGTPMLPGQPAETMRSRGGFTLVELLAVVAIIAIMAAMLLPQVGKFQERSQSVVCMSNLRQIGVAVLNYVGDNNNDYPVIEPDPQNPVYPPLNDSSDPNAIQAKPMLDVLGPYGVTDAVLKCPADINGPNWYAANDPHTSYQWRVILTRLSQLEGNKSGEAA